MKTVDTKHLETKSDAKREAEAMARLRETALTHSDFIHVPVRVADITALLGRAALLDEALDALKRKVVDVSADRTWCSLCRTEAPWNLEPDRADRHPHAVSCVLAKAGRR